LSETIAPNAVRLALALADAALADRLAALLTGVPGLRLVSGKETADAVVMLPTDPSPAADGAVPLTPRELEVLTLLAEGASNKMIAQRLGISVHTAKFHVGSLLDKFDAIGRTDAVAHAARLGVINL
jgi:DNA-binding CsgD family transcriptional regulator